MRRWSLAWLVLALAVAALEALALIAPGGGDTLSAQVVALIEAHPETFGGTLAALFGWLAWHWGVAPLWKRRRPGEGDPKEKPENRP